jgi:hypothetical protein
MSESKKAERKYQEPEITIETRTVEVLVNGQKVQWTGPCAVSVVPLAGPPQVSKAGNLTYATYSTKFPVDGMPGHELVVRGGVQLMPLNASSKPAVKLELNGNGSEPEPNRIYPEEQEPEIAESE